MSRDNLRGDCPGSAVSANPHDCNSLAGKHIVVLRDNDFSVDSRIRKQCRSLISAGAVVTLIGRGSVVAPDLAYGGAQVELLSPNESGPRFGRESVWWPLRVLVNTTHRYCRSRRPTQSAPPFSIDFEMLRRALDAGPDIVIAIDSYVLETAFEVKRLTGCPVVLEVLDLVSDVDYHDAETNRRLRHIEDARIPFVDEVITVSEPMAQVLRERHRIDSIHVVFSAPEMLVPSGHAVASPPRLLFQGAFLENRNLRMLIEAVGLMRNPAVLTLQGFGAQRSELEELVKTSGVSTRVRFAEPVTPEGVVLAASEHDIGLVTYRAQTLNLEVTVPNKLLDYLGAGLAVAVTDLPGPRSVLAGSDSVEWVDSSSAQALARALDRLVSDPERIAGMKLDSAELAQEYSWEIQEPVYLGALCRSLSAADTHALAGVRVAYVSVGGFAGVWRSIKQGRSVVGAGGSVTYVGYDGLIPKQILESGMGIHATPGLKLTTSRSPLRVLRIALNVLFHHPRNTWIEKTSQRVFAESARVVAPHVVQAVDLPSLEAAAMIARGSGAALVFDSGEYWRGFVDNPDMNLTAESRASLMEMESRYLPQCAVVFTTSESMADRLVADHGIKRPVTLYNSPPQRREVAAPSQQPLRLVFHGGLSHDRNLCGLLHALVLLEGSATLDIHGMSRTQAVEDLEALVEELGLSDVVTLHGRFEYPDVVDMLSVYDVGVLAHQMADENFRYTLPNKVFDCMCAGLAVAMSDSPPMRTLVEDEGFGIILDSTSPEAIATGLAELVGDRSRVDAMKLAAVAASERYWWPVQGKKVVCEIHRILRQDADA